MSTQNRTIITTTEPVTPLLLLSAMGREVNGICLEWISAPVNKHGETYDWKCGISADGLMIQAEAETGPLGVIEAGLADLRVQVDLRLRREMTARKAAAKAEKGRWGEGERENPNGLDTSKPRPRRILIHGEDDRPADVADFDACLRTVENPKSGWRLYMYRAKLGDFHLPLGEYPADRMLQWFGIKLTTTKPETEVAP